MAARGPLLSEESGKIDALESAPAALKTKAGFTLLEVLIVLSIIALIAALVGPRLFGQFDRSKVTAAAVQVKSLKSALDTMQLDIGRYPSEQEGLTLLVQAGGDGAGNWSGPYLSGALPKDPWGHDYIYVAPSADNPEPKVCTYGDDGKPGGSGNAADVCS
jgi:general secretion pathway protein G